MGRIRYIAIVLFVILVVALAAVIYVVPSVTGMLVETYPAEYGELEIYDDAVGYFFRDEEVYGSKNGGSLNRLAQEGELLRPFTNVVEITGGSAVNTAEETPDTEIDKPTEIKNKIAGKMKTVDSYQIESGGIVSYFVDGNEYDFTVDRASRLNLSQMQSIKQSGVIEIGNNIRAGYPSFKIISNGGWRLVAYIPKESMHQYEEGAPADVTFFERDDSEEEMFPDLSEKDPLYKKVEMNVVGVSSEGDYGKLVLRSIRFFDGMGKYRVADCRIVSHDVTGIKIENNSLTELDGVQGVYVKNKKGKYDFMPVYIYGSDGTTTVVADKYFYDANGEYTRTIDPFDDILRNPTNQEEEKPAEEG